MKKNGLMYLAGGTAGALVGVLILWIVLPAGAVPTSHVHTFETVSIEELQSMLDRGAVTVIDVRNVEPYMASHIPGALQIPVTMIEGEIPYLPKDKPIVTYCSCPAEETSGHAAMVLANGGVTRVAALKGGFDEWVAKGLPTRSGRESTFHP
ncbi:MAG TPA: rhodanese-like domain-containing protein [Thermoanaerobaculia bacterium]|nr:rhodanese-like domain-containing protein [Thermoanaerobaculia bacterium]